MDVVKTIAEVRAHVAAWRKQGKSVGLVTTMGYLHAGHQSLIKKSVEENDKTVVTIFVNPMQFGPTEDLESYPRDLEKDTQLCKETGANLIFAPEPEEMYDKGFVSFVDMNGLTNHLCGLSRPIHFRGVCTVVNKFFNIVQPDRAYFGQKDAQQLAVIKRMVKDLNMNLEIVGCPIVREEDGLAMSSRNTYMDEKERKAALILSRSLLLGKKIINDGETDPKKVTDEMKKLIKSEPMAEIDYVEIVNNETMESVDKIEGEILCAIAVKINNKVRLIDNFIMKVR
ncbi:MAG: pantoate--beta-alanine ligase [Eubacterium sp.]|nr:pantoate--beta-alanine ligase [Eubacterium sp.]SEF48233.1 pantoate--beta-alanine ligase [Eubacterium ruminantium]